MHRLISLAVVAVALVACRESSGPRPPAVDSTIPDRVEVQPPRVTLYPGQSQQFTTTIRDLAGRPVLPDAKLSWSSTNFGAVGVDSNGLAIARLNTPDGVKIVATYGQLTGSADVTIGDVFNVWSDTNALMVGMTRKLTARTIQHPNPKSYISTPTVPSSWSSADPTIVSVDAVGILTAQREGQTTLTAALSDGRTASAVVIVLPQKTLRFSSVYTTFNSAPSGLFKWAGCGLNAADGGMYCWDDFGRLWGETVLPGYNYMSLPDSYVQAFDRCEHFIVFGAGNVSWLDRTRCSDTPVRFFSQSSFSALGGWSCGLSASGEASCWGSNKNGELGIGTSDADKHGPTAVATAERFQTISVSGSTRCALRADGVAFCWGGAFGPTVTRMAGSVTWRRLERDGQCGLATDSTAYCWSGSAAPAAVGSGRKFVDVVSAFVGNRCGLTATGSLYCWRRDATTASLIEPPIEATGAPPLASMAVDWLIPNGGVTRVCGLTGTGDLYCVAQSGSGSSEIFSLERRDFAGLQFKNVWGNCGIATDDKTYCWTFTTSPVRQLPGQ